MIESNNPQVDVEQLMRRVRREATAVRVHENGSANQAPAPVAAVIALPPIGDLPAPPPLGSSGPLEVKKDRLDSLLKQAREMTEVGRGIPKFLRGLFRKQGGYNRTLLDAVAALTKTNIQLNKRVQELQAAAQQHHDWIQILTDRRRADADWMKTAAPLIANFGAMQATAQQTARLHGEHDARLRNLETQTDRTLDDLQQVNAQTIAASAHLRDLQAQADRAGAHLRNVDAQAIAATEHLTSLQAQADRAGAHLRNVDAQANATGEHLRNLQGQADRSADDLKALREQGERAGEHLRNLQHQADRHGDAVSALQETIERAASHLTNLQTQVDTSGEHLRNLQRTADQLLAIYDQNERAAEHLRNLQVQVDRQADFLQGLREQVERDGEHLRHLQDTANTSGEHLRNLQDEADRAVEQLRDLRPLAPTTARLEAQIVHLEDVRRTLSRLEERQASDAIYLRGQLAHHVALLQQTVVGPRGKKTAANARGAKSPAKTVESDHASATELDAFYVRFENRFRGTRLEIKDRVRFYLPMLEAAKAGAKTRPILDVGCGRGEWLELLAENKMRASGVDLNTAMVTECTERDLDATHGDAIAHLRSLGDETLGCVSGFHIIEHLPFETLLELFIQAQRVLKPGGLAIFESPNCKNLMVGACYFNVDPTHRNPVFPETAEFMMEMQGFADVQLEYLSPAARPFTNGDHDAEMLNDLLFGPQDFAVIGYKPAAQ